jgi:hypothetical protein
MLGELAPARPAEAVRYPSPGADVPAPPFNDAMLDFPATVQLTAFSTASAKAQPDNVVICSFIRKSSPDQARNAGLGSRG